ncbi:MAG: long-chain fatty acid--CoA ligase [Propionibacteriaceae bacterium]|jgi:long-chain acyl-CoA synthetase|nr:long-chain fatty acid--CoA ligase [Propionibacteriaceae bacterium]
MMKQTPSDTAALQSEISARSAQSVSAILVDRIRKTPDYRAFLYPDKQEVWHDLSWAQTAEAAYAFAAGLIGRGLVQEDRVAIIAMTRIEWALADYGITLAGCATTTVYPNTKVEDVAFILSDSDSKIVLAEDATQVDKVTAHHDLDDAIGLIIVMDGPGDGHRVLAWEDFLDEGRAYLSEHPGCVDEAVARTTRDHLATLIYTSGTTGRPKGVRLKHSAWTYLAESVEMMDLVTSDLLSYLWLPLSHTFGKSMMVFQAKYGFQTAIDGRIDKIVENLAIVKPSFMCGVPRIFEKVRAAVLTGETSHGLKGRIAHWAFATGYKAIPYRLASKPMPPVLRARFAVADKLVFSKLRDKMGGNIRFMISGAAKLSPQVQKWFYAAGIIVVEGYGMTETATVNAVNHYRQPVFGSLGRPIPGLEARIADDGEILFRAPVVMDGYHKNPQATAEAIDPEGWFHTGDIGYLGDDGQLRVTDRKKDLMKTSGGKYVAPTKVEAALMANVPYISAAIAVGDGHKYIAALLVMDREGLLRWGRNHGHPQASYAELTQLPQIRASIDRFVARANTHLEHWETVKRYAILDHELTVESGAVTESMKIKRANVIATHRGIVDSLFDDVKDSVDEG